MSKLLLLAFVLLVSGVAHADTAAQCSTFFSDHAVGQNVDSVSLQNLEEWLANVHEREFHDHERSEIGSEIEVWKGRSSGSVGKLLAKGLILSKSWNTLEVLNQETLKVKAFYQHEWSGLEIKVIENRTRWLDLSRRMENELVSVNVQRHLNEQPRPWLLVVLGESQLGFGQAKLQRGPEDQETLLLTSADGKLVHIDLDFLPKDAKIYSLSGSPETSLIEPLRRVWSLSSMQDLRRTQRQRLARSLLEPPRATSHPSGHSIFARSDLYEFLSADPDEARLLVIKWFTIFKSWKGNAWVARRSRDMVRFVENKLGSAYIGLLADPGIFTRFAQFKRFVESRTSPPVSPFALRQQFTSSMGTRRAFRALLLTESELERIQAEGIESPFHRQLSTARQIKELFQHLQPFQSNLGPSLGPAQDIQSRLSPFSIGIEAPLSMSLTAYPEVGISATYHSQEKTRLHGKKIYLFTLEVDEIDIIERIEGVTVGHSSQSTIQIGNDRWSLEDPNVEFFLFGRIGANQIKAIEEITSIPLPYKFTPDQR